jgi:hypothetical protein
MTVLPFEKLASRGDCVQGRILDALEGLKEEDAVRAVLDAITCRFDETGIVEIVDYLSQLRLQF